MCIIIHRKACICVAGEVGMRFESVTKLQRELTRIVSEIEETGEPVVITKHGKPVVIMQPITENAFTLKEGEGA